MIVFFYWLINSNFIQFPPFFIQFPRFLGAELLTLAYIKEKPRHSVKHRPFVVPFGWLPYRAHVVSCLSVTNFSTIQQSNFVLHKSDKLTLLLLMCSNVC